MIANLEAEAAVLGCALFEPSACAEAFDRVRPEHFAEPVHGELWKVLTALGDVQGAAGAPIVHERMKAHPAYLQLGGVGLLADLVDQAPPANSVMRYGEIVLDYAVRRALHATSLETSKRCFGDFEADAEAILTDIERSVSEIGRQGTKRIKAVSAGATATEMVERAAQGDFEGVQLGLECLDRVTGGIHQDDVWIVGGRSSMGKSVCGLSLARGLAQQGRGVLMFSLEMPLREVQARLIADLAYRDDLSIRLRYGDILKGRGEAALLGRAKAAARDLASMPLVVDDAGGKTIGDIRSAARRQVRAWERLNVQPGAVLIDHLGLIRAHTQRGDSKAAETADIVNELKDVAKSVGAPVIALAQVNRGPEQRNDKRPTMADLNWSGAIEQIADLVCLLYRPAYYLERSGDADEQLQAQACAHELELIIAKNRSGPICNIKAWVDVACNALRDPDQRTRAYA